ncbi:hypothetical protein [Nocardia sp. CDC160]|uniref:hypothetical protein n=1 Tax=Nocardia sp. CDC160 TaxID=3112166 RepID=UPI002DB61C42|nr:hypothetical protein [Nocardia sp. CDC160]MEC3914776.1 hypothetical protein [Nocardia sp. CDC160]
MAGGGVSWRRRMRRWRWPEPRWIAGLGVGVATVLTLSTLARGLPDYWRNFELNTAADLIGAVFTIFLLTPIIQRVGESRVREHRELDYGRFLDRADRSTDAVRVVDTFSNMLLDPYVDRFRRITRAALARGVSVRILLINPSTLAAEQRDLELGAAEDLQRQLARNLTTLRDMQREIGELVRKLGGRGLRGDFQVRLYYSGPDVTMYRSDDRCLISFYTLGELSGDSRQLEVSVRSPLGKFVNDRFHAVWARSAPLEHLIGITLSDGHGDELRRLVRSIVVDNVRYLHSSRVDRFLDRDDADAITAKLDSGDDYTLTRVADEALTARLTAVLSGIFSEAPTGSFHRLDPIDGIREQAREDGATADR